MIINIKRLYCAMIKNYFNKKIKILSCVKSSSFYIYNLLLIIIIILSYIGTNDICDHGEARMTIVWAKPTSWQSHNMRAKPASSRQNLDDVVALRPSWQSHDIRALPASSELCDHRGGFATMTCLASSGQRFVEGKILFHESKLESWLCHDMPGIIQALLG
jgi:hypothetical protein